MLKWWVYVLILIFILDIFYRVFYRTKIDKNSFNTSNFSKNIFESNHPKNISEEKNDSKIKYDKKKFDPEIMHFYSKKKNNKKTEIIEDDDDDDEIVYSPKNKIKNIDDDEFDGLIPKPQKRINVTIEYDDKYQNLYNELSQQLDGNISYLDFYPKIANIQSSKKVIKYFLYFILVLVFLCIYFIEKIINSCCNGMNEGFKSLISLTKYFIFGLIYLFIMYLIRKISHTNIFEVYVNRKLKYSTILKEEPPTYVILYNILKNLDSN